MAIKDLNAYYRGLANRYAKRYNDAVTDYLKQIEAIRMNKKEVPTFFDYVGGAFTLGGQALKGMFNAYTNFGSLFTNIVTGLFQDASEVGAALGSEDYDEAGRDAIRMVANPFLMLLETVVNGSVGLTGTALNLIGVQDADKATQFITQTINNGANAVRAYIETGDASVFDVLNFNLTPRPQMPSFTGLLEGETPEPTYEDFLSPESLAQIEKNKQIIQAEFDDSQFLDPFQLVGPPNVKGQIGGVRPTYTYGDFVKDNAEITSKFNEGFSTVTDAFVNGFGLINAQTNSEEVFGGDKLYETLKGVMDSVGAIFAMRTVGTVAAKAGLKPSQVQQASGAFFWGNTAGKSVNEALNNGADVQDAFSYGFSIATSESFIENLAGIKFGAINNSLASSGFWNFLKNAAEEGVEEIIAEFIAPGYETILGNDVELSPEDTLTNAFTAFLSGAAASSLVGAGQAVILNNTVDRKNQNFIRKFNEYRERYGQELALEKFKLEIVDYVKYINRKNVKGQVYNENGSAYIDTLTQEQKDKIVANSVARLFVKRNSDGTYEVDQEALDNFTEAALQITDKDGNVLNMEEYAVNDYVYGLDITDDGEYQVKKISELNAKERAMYEIANKLKVPIAIVSGAKGSKLSIGTYGNNGVFYIDATNIENLTPEQVTLEVAKHESIHALQKEMPLVYQQLLKTVEGIVKLAYDKETKKVKLEFVDESVKEKLPNLESDLQNAIDTYILDGVDPNAALILLQNELAPYFVEKVITDAALINTIGKKDRTLLDRISEFFGIEKDVEVNLNTEVKQINKKIKAFANTWKNAMQVYVKKQQSIINLIERIAGPNIDLLNIFSKEALDKYSVEDLQKAFQTFNPKDNTVVLNGEKINFDDIKNPNFTFTRPQKARSLSDDELGKTFQYDVKKSNEYYTMLRRYEKSIDAGIVYLPRESADFKDARARLNIVEKLTDQYKDNRRIIPTPSEMYVLAEAEQSFKQAQKEKQEQIRKEKQLNPRKAIVNTSIKRFVMQFKDTSFGFKNRFTTYGGAVYQEVVESRAQAEDLLKAVQIITENLATKKGKTLLRGRYSSSLVYDRKTKLATIIAKPTENFIEEQVKAQEVKFEERQEQKPIFVGVDSENFELTQEQVDYFKNTVVKKEGKLLPVHQGNGDANISFFKEGDGYIFFYDDFGYAQNQADESGENSKVYSVYLNMKKPLDLRTMTAEKRNLIARLGAKKFEETVATVKERIGKAENQALLKVYLDAADLIEEGYDGIISETNGVTEYGVFDGEQIKSIENQSPELSKNIYDDIRPQKARTRKLTDVEKEQIRDVFPDDAFISEYFEISKSGNLVLKEKYVRSTVLSKNYATIRLYGQDKAQKFRASEYALNVDVGSDVEVVFDVANRGFEIVKLSEILADKKKAAVYHMLKASGIRFVLFKPGTGSKTAGFSKVKFSSDYVFINADILGKDIISTVEILFHEFFHETFKRNIDLASKIAPIFIELLKNPKFILAINKTVPRTGKYSDAEYKNAFVNYLKNSYPDRFEGLTEENMSQYLQKLLDNMLESSKDLDVGGFSFRGVNKSINELLAQLLGVTMSSETVAKEMNLSGYESDTLYNIYDVIMEDSSIPKSSKDALKTLVPTFKNAVAEHNAKMKSLFPNETEKIGIKSINTFINEFTDGKYKTKVALFRKYQEELSQGKKGEATRILDSIIRITTKFAPLVTKSGQKVNILKDYFQKQLDKIQTLIDNPDDAAYISLRNMPQEYKRLVKALENLKKKYGPVITSKAPLTTLAFQSSEEILEFARRYQEFVVKYSALDPDILEVFDLPDATEIEKLGVKINDAVDTFVDAQDKYREIENPTQSQAVKQTAQTINFISSFNELMEKLSPIDNLTEENYGLLLNVAQLQETIFDLDTQKMYLILKNAIEAAKKKINTGNQAKTELNDELSKSFQALNGILNLLKGKVSNKDVLKTRVLEAIRALDKIITGSKRFQDIFTSTENIATKDLNKVIDAIRKKYLTDLYGYYGAIFNEQDALKDFIDANSATVEEAGYDKNYIKLGRSISNLLFALQTQYQSVFGGTYREVAEREIKVLSDVLNDKGNIKELSGSLDNLELPQHIIQRYAKFFQTYKSQLFDQFFDIYIDMTIRKQMIEQKYDEAIKQFIADNKGILEFELEKITLPKGLFYKIKPTNEIVENVKKKRKAQSDKLAENNKKIKDIREERTKERKEKARKMDVRRGVLKNSKEYETLTKEIRALVESIKLKTEQIQKIQQENESLKAQRLTFQTELKIALIEATKDEALPELSRGELIKLYMDIKRENEMHNNEDNSSRVKPTQHFDIGGSFQVFDSTKEYSKAKAEADKNFYVIVNTRQEMLEIIEDLLNKDERYQKLIDFARLQHKTNYEYINEIYKARFQQDLPQEVFYSPYRTNDSDWVRNFELRQKGARNIGVEDGFTLETTLGARTPLVVQNITSVLNGVNRAVSRYSYERLINDFESLMTSRTGNNNRTFAQLLGGIDNNNFKTFFVEAFSAILGYGAERQDWATRTLNTLQNRSIRVTMALSFSVYIKQFISVFKLSSGSGLNPLEVAYNVLVHGINPLKATATRKWLMENNPQMYQRSQFGGLPNLSEPTTSVVTKYSRGLKKGVEWFRDKLDRFNNYADSTTLVAAFAAIVRRVQKMNPELSLEEARQEANRQFNRQALLFDVASTDTAFRTRFSNSKSFWGRFFAKYQSENLIHISATLNAIKNKGLGTGGKEDIFEAIFMFFISSLASALVGSAFGRFNGYVDEDEVLEDLLLNELLLQNLIGAIPIVNQFTNVFQIKDGVLQQVYTEKLPGISDGIRAIDVLIKSMTDIIEGEAEPEDIFRSLFRFAEETSVFYGIPVRNLRKGLAYILKLETAFGGESYYGFEEFWYNRSDAQQLGYAVRNNDEAKIQNYIGRTFSKNEVKEEMLRLIGTDDKASISLKFNATTFKAKNLNDEMVEYNIPEKTREKYKIMAQRALSYLVRNSRYKKLSDRDKLATIQRVLNYYYNFMKNEVLVEEYKSLSAKDKMRVKYNDMRRKRLKSYGDVITQAMRRDYLKDEI